MGHTVANKSKLIARVRRIKGQVDALERGLSEERGCAETLQQIAAVRGAINGLMGEVLEGHLRTHVADPNADAEHQQEMEDVLKVLRSYIK
ncbi:metal/formaldehyde-sensitive transcriptional repressor [Dyella tabacisoli]|uniref:Metal/formaldehyde-sensitive transcriptional repressor n=1 Tax=Dyella tabacisoli TaxID=2282381 RepID=A0A369URY2_9GAMM|nr:metal/formaldehyde-sensitive transcriptional repressor [Dyella tabacisoli]RDD82795.1 metal/formaldehyde-sensitive transcriptional repressor [Dyella tabacisoli]